MAKVWEKRIGTIIDTKIVSLSEAHYTLLTLDLGDGSTQKCRVNDPVLFTHLEALFEASKNGAASAEILVRGFPEYINHFVEHDEVFRIYHAERAVDGLNGKSFQVIDRFAAPLAA